MDCSCNCFGVATAARVPVKRYNLLVPDVFPVTEPSFEHPLGLTIERKIKKLAEYLDKNEHRVPKVSRRLQRRLHSDLEGGRYGYVALAVAAYDALLVGGRPERAGLLANELVVQTVVKRRTLPLGRKVLLPFPEPHLGSAAGLLLSHASPRLRKLGVDLLIDFTKRQQTSDYVPQLEAFVPLLCANAKPHMPAAGSGASRAASPGASPAHSGRRSSRGAAAEAAGAAEAEHWAQLRAACLRALLEHLRFCARLSYVSYHLHTITFAVLECVDASGYGAPQGVYMSPRALLEAGSPVEGLVRRLSLSHTVAASPPDVAALLVFEELAHMTREAAEGKKVLEFVMRFLDEGRRWLGSPVAQTSVAVLQQACEQEHQRYLLFSTLLRHVAGAPALTPAERAAVLALAMGEGEQLEGGLAAPALLLALRELPAVIASLVDAGGEVPAMPQLPAPPVDLPTPYATATDGEQLTLDAAEADAADAAGTPPSRAVAGRQEVELPRLSVGKPAAAPAPAAPAALAPVDLQALVLAAVQQLAARVEDSGQLVEAVSSTATRLRGAAPISTAALQCCVAAASAAQSLAPRAARGAGGGAQRGTFPSLLLHELSGISVDWGPQQRLLAHQLLLQLLPTAADGLKEQQAATLLSAVWHEAALATNTPAAFVAMDSTLQALLGAAPAAALPQALSMLAALQGELLHSSDGGAAADGSGRLAALSAAQAVALLCMCRSVLHALTAQLGQPALQQLAAPGCESVLQVLAAEAPHGLLLRGLPANGASQQQQQQQQFWQAGAATLPFAPQDEAAAAAFLAQWRRATTPASLQAAAAAALQAMPLFKQGGSSNGRVAAAWQPAPLASLMPRLMQCGSSFANGSHGGSEGESKRAQRLRSVYRHMRQVSLCDSDRAALATISQEHAAEEPAAAALQLQGLGLDGEGGGGGESGGGHAAGPPSVDAVLAEVDAALAAAELALEQQRSPSPPPGWRGSSGSLGSRGGGGAPAVRSESLLGGGDRP